MPHDKKRALRVIEFMQLLHLTDDFYGQPMVLMKWQHDVLWDVYGTVDERGYRQYRFAYLEIPKKNSKTTTIAGTALAHLALDPPGGQIYCCAADREQASLIYKAALQMIEQEPELDGKEGGILKVTDSKKLIENKETGTFMRVLSAEAYTKHGINPTVVIFDELHAQPNRALWDTMTFGSGAARKETLYWVITTAGDDPDHKSIGWEIHEYAMQIRDGVKKDPAWYVKIFAAPDDADIYAEATWYAANPSLGITIDIENVRQEAIAAKNRPAAEKLFRWLRLNQWVSRKSTSWLDLTLWDQTTGSLTKFDLQGKRCYAGLDLSTVNDLTGIALLFPPQEGVGVWRNTGQYTDDKQPIQELKQCWYFVVWAFHPLENMQERVKKDHVAYDEWAKEGWLDATPGNVIDYTFIEAKIAQINQQYDVVAWGNDPRGAEKLRQDLINDHDIELIEVAQGTAQLSEPMKEIERLSKLGEMAHERNPLGRWNWGNVTIYVDGNGNYKPLKNKAVERMDTMAALFNAMHLALKMEEQRTDFIGIAVG